MNWLIANFIYLYRGYIIYSDLSRLFFFICVGYDDEEVDVQVDTK